MASYEDMKGAMKGLDPFDAAVPGESLTRDPSMRAPYEKPPEHTNKDKAVEELFMRLTEEDTIDDFLDLMRMGTPVEYIAQVVLFEGFRSGKFNPDLMLLLIEPTIYILLYIADLGGVDDVVLYPEGDRTAQPIQMTEEGAISVGNEQVARPESVTPSLMEAIKAKQGEE